MTTVDDHILIRSKLKTNVTINQCPQECEITGSRPLGHLQAQEGFVMQLTLSISNRGNGVK